jgi:hypothetical protein
MMTLYPALSDEAVLRMPARRFFILLRQGRKIRLKEYAELCDIQAISIAPGNREFYVQLKRSYLALIQEEDRAAGVKPAVKRPPAAPSPPLDAAAAKATFIDLAQVMKGSHGR